MIGIPDLRTAILDLLYELRGSDINVIIAGGFGIFLKIEYVKTHSLRTLFEEWPEPRSTKDIDLFLGPELLIDSSRLRPLKIALDNLGYKVVPGAEKYQFVKTGMDGMEHAQVKIDLLTGPQSRFDGTNVKTDSRRARPKPSVDIHAHPVDEAPTLEDGLTKISLNGFLSSGKSWEAEIFLPHPFTFLMMKLFAFRDQCNNPENDYGRHHALDLYSVLGTTTEPEWEDSLGFRNRLRTERYVGQARDIVLQYFGDREALGVLRLKESTYYRDTFQDLEFISALLELFYS